MRDLVLLELLIGGILFLSLIRPFVKAFRGVDGLALLPAVSAVLALALFPAYGFRPEALPLALFAVIRFFLGLPYLSAVLRRMRADDYGERPFLPSAVGILLLAGVCAFAVRYAPAVETGSRYPFASYAVTDEERGMVLHLRTYSGEEAEAADAAEAAPTAPNPTVLLLPPLSGSVAVVDRVCEALATAGFPVRTYSREGLDVPAFRTDGGRAYPSAGRLFRHGAAFLAGTRYRAANEWGRRDEEERLADLSFLVRHLEERGEGRGGLLIVGYGTAASAAVRYAEGAPASVLGVVAVEGHLLSSLLSEPPRTVGAEAGLRGRLNRAADALRPLRMVGVGGVPSPSVPVLFILSDRIKEIEERDGRYSAVLRVLRSARFPTLLAALDGAGPFDYSDMAAEYPLYSALVPGLGSVASPDRARYVADTAALIRNFSIMAAAAKDPEGTVPAAASGFETLQSPAYLEAGGPWKSAAPTDILGR